MAEVNATPGNDIPTNQTIYINNLNEKIKLDGILVASLSAVILFSVYSMSYCFLSCGLLLLIFK